MVFSLEKIKNQARELEKRAVIKKVNLETFIVDDGAGRIEEMNMPIIWGSKETSWSFKTNITLPILESDESIRLYFHMGDPRDRTACESILYINGKRYFGLDNFHKSCDLPKEMGIENQIEIEIISFGGLLDQKYLFDRAELWKENDGVVSLSRWLETIAESTELIPENDVARYQLIQLLSETYQKIDMFTSSNADFIESINHASAYLMKELDMLPKDEYVPKVKALGHSHIDLAYLWRIEHTRRKSIHTFTTVLTLMEKYPEFKYIQSQPQIYEYLERDAPEIFKQIQQRVTEGRWEVEGGMWVEADCNIPSGESLVRQFLYGINYFKDKFGKRNKILWLPDVFGYSYALPQILKLCGIDYFMTTKISWNDTNRPAHDTFQWKGIDGSEVLTHFITTPENGETRYTYNGLLDPEHVTGLWENYRQKDINDELLLIFGYGDGGGGPTVEMIETGRRMKKIPRTPQVEIQTAGEYFDALAKMVNQNVDLPYWEGELYLEYHRGTYTSQAKNKRYNRYSEHLLREAEMWNGVMLNQDHTRNKFEETWKLILKNQFHDIIPGTGIPEVHEDSDKDYEQIFQNGDELLQLGLTEIANRLDVEEPSILIFNSLPWEQDVWIDHDGKNYKIDAVSSCGYKLIAISELIAENQESGIWNITTEEIENDFFRIEFAGNGQITRFLDKQHDFEVLATGENGNVLEIFEDHPLKYDNWNIDEDAFLKSREVKDLLEAKIIINDGVKGVIGFKWKWKKSVIEQQLIVWKDKPYIDFETIVDWQERRTLLKVAFPINVRSSFATYDIQFGNVQRPTHSNTSWDAAQFETCAHKWIDLSDSGQGVSLINDCKYGHDVKGNRLRTTLIKSGNYPDPEADKGEHLFKYRLYSHAGNWLESDTNKLAYEFNIPLQTMVLSPDQANSNRERLPNELSFVAFDSSHVMLETLKIAEDGNGIILRLNEYGNKRDLLTINFYKQLTSVTEVNLLEEKLDELVVEYGSKGSKGSKFSFEIKPYQIKTFRLTFEN